MKLTKQRKAYVGLLALALGALGLDHVLGGSTLPGPQSAEASDLLIPPGERSTVEVSNADFVEAAKAESEAHAGSEQGKGTTTEQNARAVVSIAAQLEAWAGHNALGPKGMSGQPDASSATTVSAGRDAFALPVALLQIVRSAENATQQEGPASGVTARASASSPAFRLSAILLATPDTAPPKPGSAAREQPMRAVAMINDTPCRVGTKIDGWTLVKVEERQVMLEGPAGERQLIQLPDAQSLVKSRLPSGE